MIVLVPLPDCWSTATVAPLSSVRRAAAGSARPRPDRRPTGAASCRPRAERRRTVLTRGCFASALTVRAHGPSRVTEAERRSGDEPGRRGGRADLDAVVVVEQQRVRDLVALGQRLHRAERHLAPELLGLIVAEQHGEGDRQADRREQQEQRQRVAQRSRGARPGRSRRAPRAPGCAGGPAPSAPRSGGELPAVGRGRQRRQRQVVLAGGIVVVGDVGLGLSSVWFAVDRRMRCGVWRRLRCGVGLPSS